MKTKDKYKRSMRELLFAYIGIIIVLIVQLLIELNKVDDIPF